MSVLIIVVVAMMTLVATFGYGHSVGVDSERLSQSRAVQDARDERDSVVSALAERDQELAVEQARVAQVRTETVIKWEVIYRDRIKDPDMRKCVIDSGLLDLYDAANGVSATVGGSDGTQRPATGDQRKP